MTEYRYLFAVDPSLTCSGWALFEVGGARLKLVGKIRSEPPKVPLAERLRLLFDCIEDTMEQLKLSSNDILVCEAATTMRDPNAALKVEQVRGMFESSARARKITVPGRINPRSVQYEVMGLRGKQMPRQDVKAAALNTVESLYGNVLMKIGLIRESSDLKRHQDIVDAILVGQLAISRIRSARQGNMPTEVLFREERRGRPRHTVISE